MSDYTISVVNLPPFLKKKKKKKKNTLLELKMTLLCSLKKTPWEVFLNYFQSVGPFDGAKKPLTPFAPAFLQKMQPNLYRIREIPIFDEM